VLRRVVGGSMRDDETMRGGDEGGTPKKDHSGKFCNGKGFLIASAEASRGSSSGLGGHHPMGKHHIIQTSPASKGGQGLLGFWEVLPSLWLLCDSSPPEGAKGSGHDFILTD